MRLRAPRRYAVTGAKFDARTYWTLRLERNWSLQGVGLTKQSLSYNRWLYRVRDRVFRRALAVTDLVAVTTPKVLDVGPGVGFYVERWRRRGADVTAIDIADSVVERLGRDHPDVRVLRLDVSDDVSALGSGYDAVTAFDVLFHIVDDARFVRAFRNVAGLLRPGGWFVFTESMACSAAKPAPHYVRRSSSQTEAAASAAGLEIVWTAPAFVLMTYPFDARNPIWRERWKRYIAVRTRTRLGGNVIGGLLFVPELLLTRVRRSTPGASVVVCRKPIVNR